MGCFGLCIFYWILILCRLLNGEVSREFDSCVNFYFVYLFFVFYLFGLENVFERVKMDILFFLINVYEVVMVCDVVFGCVLIELIFIGWVESLYCC